MSSGVPADDDDVRPSPPAGFTAMTTLSVIGSLPSASDNNNRRVISDSVALDENPSRVEQRLTSRLPTPSKALGPLIRGRAKSAIRSGDDMMRRAHAHYTLMKEEGLTEHVNPILLTELDMDNEKLALKKSRLEQGLQKSRDLFHTIGIAYRARRYAKAAIEHRHRIVVTSEEARNQKALENLERELEQNDAQRYSERIDNTTRHSWPRMDYETSVPHPVLTSRSPPSGSTNPTVIASSSRRTQDDFNHRVLQLGSFAVRSTANAGPSTESRIAVHRSEPFAVAYPGRDSVDTNSSYHTAEDASLESHLAA